MYMALDDTGRVTKMRRSSLPKMERLMLRTPPMTLTRMSTA